MRGWGTDDQPNSTSVEALEACCAAAPAFSCQKLSCCLLHARSLHSVTLGSARYAT